MKNKVCLNVPNYKTWNACKQMAILVTGVVEKLYKYLMIGVFNT
jgi:hypothetical protein